ncbi:MAG: histidine kinase [Herminiimonas sp.]|nr:histidine kinase [Herminiimonas sp.]
MKDNRQNPSNETVHALFRQQDVLAKFAELALRSNSLDNILHEACRLVGEALGTDLAKVMELQEDGMTLLVRAGAGWKPGVVGVVKVKADINTSEGYALRSGKPAISADIENETRFKYDDFLLDNGVKALINVPIIGTTNQAAYGILQVDSRTPREFGEADILFLRGYANLLASTVERLRIHSAMQELNETLERRVADRTRSLEKAQQDKDIAEEQLRQSQKVEAIGQLTGGIAHDFNNMLAGIMGNLELLKMRVEAGKTDDLVRYVDGALSVTNRAAALTHRLLAFSRRQTLDPKPVHVNRLVLSMQDLFQRTLGPTTSLRTQLDEDLWTAICDPNQLESALLNLAINSRDAMPAGGLLTIQTSNRDIDVAESTGFPEVAAGKYVQIDINDTGVGMSSQVLGRAVDPFYTTKPLGKGTGLGLSMIYGFVQQSRGYLHIESQPEIGTSVHILLPSYVGKDGDEIEDESVKRPPEFSRALPDRTVLFVDDEESLRNLGSEVLRDLGYTVIVASDAKEALKTLESPRHIDLLVSDVGLPNGMNGRQLADAARVWRPQLKVLFVTGFAENAAVGNGMLEPGMQVMTKPFSMMVFAGKVKDMIDA